MPSPPLGAGFVEILLMHRVARLHLLPQISADASQFLVRHGLPIAAGAPGFVRPLDRRLARGREEVNGAAMAFYCRRTFNGKPAKRTPTATAARGGIVGDVGITKPEDHYFPTMPSFVPYAATVVW